MQTTYNELIPLISQLNHVDKLRLAQWLINRIAAEKGINEPIAHTANDQSDLCGIWQDSRAAESIVQDIISNRTESRDSRLKKYF